MSSRVTVNGADAYLAACVGGLGIIQAPRIGMQESLAAGLLAEVLPDWQAAALPVALVHGHGRSVPRRVRVVMSWLEELMRPALVSGDSE